MQNVGPVLFSLWNAFERGVFFMIQLDLKSIIIHVFGAACAFIMFHNSTDSYPSSIS